MSTRAVLPEALRACLFDLDGVLTQTALVHAAAWKEMFDAFLTDRARRTGAAAEPFTAEDYNRYVDGKPRDDGTRAFLAARGIQLPDGSDDDPPGAWTVHALGRAKNDLLLQRIHRDGVAVYEGSVRFVAAARAAGLRTAVVSSSKNTQDVLHACGIEDLFDARVDGVTARERGLPGKPAPDTFLAGAQAVGVPAAEAVVFEDALAGVAAGRAGRFGLVVGVDRIGGGSGGHAQALLAHGADIVVGDLSEIDLPPSPGSGSTGSRP
jgi:beta-phosphoglucomutase family hydrolase